MRVIAGKFRSHLLISPRGGKTRPTSDRLRETLFNVLAPRIEGAIFADLFAGTGAVGIEALSRGAQQVYFAENAKPPLAALEANLKKLKVEARASIETAGTLALLHRLRKQQARLDIVFLDPPYSDEFAYRTTLEILSEQAVLAAGAIVIAEHGRRQPLSDFYGQLQAYRTIEQSESALTFFRVNSLGGSGSF